MKGLRCEKVNLRIIDLGLCDYDVAYRKQLEVLAEVQQGAEDTLILLEHPKVITLGRNANPSNLLMSHETLIEKGYQIRSIERGGDATYHGPGQLVGYTIFNLKDRHPEGVKAFVHRLEACFIDMLQQTYAIEGRRDDCNSGVFIGNSKVTAIGLAIKRGVAMHGFAFNVNTQLADYQVIVPCGLVDKGVTSLSEVLKQPVDMNLTKEALIQAFVNVFQYEKLILEE